MYGYRVNAEWIVFDSVRLFYKKARKYTQFISNSIIIVDEEYDIGYMLWNLQIHLANKSCIGCTEIVIPMETIRWIKHGTVLVNFNVVCFGAQSFNSDLFYVDVHIHSPSEIMSNSPIQ